MYPLKQGAFAPRNQWYVAAWSQEIGEQPIERWLLDEPVALYRKSDGAAVALEGRCPHRHFPLGKSLVVGDNVHCGYHGLTFGPDGRCVDIPTQDTIPSVCRVKSFPLVETWNWIWIWMGDPELADPALIPDHDALKLTDPAVKVEYGNYHPVPGRYMLMHDNLMDLSHVAALHRTTIASDGLSEAKEISTVGDGWLESERVLTEVSCPPYFSALFGYDGRVDRSLVMRSYLPSLHFGEDRFVRAASANEDAGKELGSVWVYHAVTPATRHKAHYFFALGRNFATDNDDFGAEMMSAIEVTLEEDMLATREVERMLGELAETPKELLIRSDAHCVKGRRMMEDLIAREAREEAIERGLATAK